jgi:hypothetical protein
MSYCTRIQRVIDEVDKPDLIPHEAASHINGCPECRGFADERTKLQELMALNGRVTVPVNFNALLNEKLSRVKAQRSSWLNSGGFVRLGTATAALAVALLAVQYSGLISSKPGNQVDQTAQNPAADVPELNNHQVDPAPRPGPVEPPNSFVSNASTTGRAVAIRASRESQVQGRGIPIFIVRDRDREVEVPMMPVSLGMQQQVLNSSGRQQLRSSDISY